MKKNFTLPVILLFYLSTITAQIDQVSVGASYSQQAYYSVSTGEVEVVENEAWDIAFSAAGQQDAGIFLNESVSFMAAPLQVFLADTEDWSLPLTDTDVFTDDVTLHNPETNWTEGAMNTVRDETSPFDYGWGVYNPQTNIVEGTKIYVIKKRDGSFIKFRVDNLSGGIYSFRYANLDGSSESSFEIDKSNANGALVHFSFDTEDKVDMPTDYDLIFQRYTTALDAGDGSFIEYTVTGVLLAPDVKAVSVDGVDPSNVNESDYTDQYSSLMTTIGHDWKSFDFQSGWLIDEDRTYFIKTAVGDIYQITFFDFEGSSTGITTLEKTLITSVSTSDTPRLDHSLKLYPNPTTEYFMIDMMTETPLEISILDNSGRLINVVKTISNSPVSVSNLSSGIYNISINSSEFIKSSRLIIK